MNDLTVSNIERQNVLNNRYAVEALQENLGFTGMLFEGEYRFTKKMVADFYEVEERTIERLLEEHGDELKYNGYILSRGKQLKEFKFQFAPVINVGSKTTQLGLFNFRAVLNVGMLLTESEKAKQVRTRIISEQEQSPAMQPFIYDAHTKMASRDVAFRDVFHNNNAGYLRAVTFSGADDRGWEHGRLIPR